MSLSAHEPARIAPGPSAPVAVEDIRRDPLAFLADLLERHGDVTRHCTERYEVITFNRPELARQVLRDRAFRKAGTPDDEMLTPLLGRGLLTSEGDVWKHQRRTTQPAFERGRVAGMIDVIVDETAALLARWKDRPAGGPTRIDHDLSSLTLAIVARAVLGSDVSGLGPRFGQSVETVNRFMGHYDPHATGEEQARDRAQFTAALRFLDGLVAILVAGRRADEVAHDDLLGRLLAGGFSGREIRDQVLTMLMAGHETTAKALGWSLILLARAPDVAARLDAEVAALGDRAVTTADLPALPTFRHVVQEALRLYPPVWLISRVAAREREVGGYRVPAGALVCVSPWFLHRHADHWDRPDEFVPARFAVVEPSWPDGAYLPFSDGPRRCIGERLALLEAQVVLAMLWRAVRVTLAAGAPAVPEALVTLRPRDGLTATVTAR